MDVEHTKSLAAKFDPAAPSQYLAKLGREVVAAVERVQALHTPWTNPTGHPYCKECLLAHPCPTRQALESAKESHGNV
ncbi:MAG: hypothetical protein WBB10_27675 [Rhodococcus qingshengii]